jgi:DMSO/TMAO reductase YedYZ molybdopterin-dependent catalytic subunit
MMSDGPESRRWNSEWKKTMRDESRRFRGQRFSLTRRNFLHAGAAGLAAINALPLVAGERKRDPKLQSAIDKMQNWLTDQDDFQDVSRGTPLPHSLPAEKLAEVGLTRDTWKLEVISDPDNPSRIRHPLSKEKNTALDFAALMQLASQHAVRFPKVMTCLNIGCPLGNGIWEGVPLRTVVWLTKPVEDLRRIFYYGYHNDDPAQMFRSSLPVGRVLEDPFDLPPVILCYKLNGEWLTPERGGPVRMVVPEAYGFKSIKWMTHVVLSNIPGENDTYADKNNDVDSPLKTFCATLTVPKAVKPGEPIPVTGWAQVGISGLSKVQVWLQNDAEELPEGDPHFTKAPWVDAEVLPAPSQFGGHFLEDRIPSPTINFDESGRPTNWPIRLTKVYWAALLPGMPAGKYTLRCRTVDEKGAAQPLPRPFKKSGHAAIEQVAIKVQG